MGYGSADTETGVLLLPPKAKVAPVGAAPPTLGVVAASRREQPPALDGVAARFCTREQFEQAVRDAEARLA